MGLIHFFFAVRRLYYLHEWKLLLYLLNSQIKQLFLSEGQPGPFSTDATDDVDVVKKVHADAPLGSKAAFEIWFYSGW